MSNSMEQLIKNIKKVVKEVVKVEGKQTIQKTVEKHKEEDVYEAYTPYGERRYERRYENKGLSDSNNTNIDIQDIDNGVNIITTDTTKANGDDLGEALAPLIEEGLYDWSHKPPKRPFIENTAEELKNGVLEKALREGLKKKGLNVK